MAAALGALICVASASPRVGSAQVAAVPGTLAGTWMLDGELSRAVHVVEAAFASSIARLPELIQGFARDRIRSDMQPPRRVVVSLRDAGVRMTLESARTTVVDGSLGAPAAVSGIDSGTRVTPRLQSGWLELRYEGEGSELRQLFSTEADASRMHVDFTVTSPQLAAPVRYRLDYVHR